jgi:hypothetical protein
MKLSLTTEKSLVTLTLASDIFLSMEKDCVLCEVGTKCLYVSHFEGLKKLFVFVLIFETSASKAVSSYCFGPLLLDGYNIKLYI